MSISNLILEDYEQYKTHIQSEFTLETYKDFLNNLSINHQIIVLKYNNVIVGSATLLIEIKLTYGGCKMGHIENVLVDDTYRGKGYGQMIINKLIDICNDNGCYRIDLICSEDLLSFYNKINQPKKQQCAISFMIEENIK